MSPLVCIPVTKMDWDTKGKKKRARAARGGREKKGIYNIKMKRAFSFVPPEGGQTKINHFDIINKFSLPPSAKTTPLFHND